MLGIQFFKADASTFVIKTANGKIKRKGKGLSFFYNAATTSIAAIPVNAQEVSFIFGLQTADYQEVRIQGQVAFQIAEPERIADFMNFNLKGNGETYASEDPGKLNDRVVRAVQTLVQATVQQTPLREALKLNQHLVALIKEQLGERTALSELGIRIMDAAITGITPAPETIRALEAEAREAILKEADDAIYLRRKSAVEQERIISEAELETQLSIQQKEQEIEESRITNERATMRGQAETERERMETEINLENQRKALVESNVDNRKREADAEAYAITARMKAIRELPVENLKAMALANMTPEQLMATAFEALAMNAGKIGELTITPDLFSQMMKRNLSK